MNLLVFGATGATGQQVMEQGLARGHRVTAVARRPAAITFAAPGLRVVPGDVTDLASFQDHLHGHDAVIAALGTRGSAAATTLYSVGAANILHAMQQHGIRRLITVTAGAYVRDPIDPPVVRLVVKPLLMTLLGAVYADMQRMEALVRASGLDWTIVQPARLADGPRTGRYRAVAEGAVPNGWQIGRADVADYILTNLDTPDTFQATVALAY